MKAIQLCNPEEKALGGVMPLEKGNERGQLEKKHVFKLRKANFKTEICVT